MAIKDNIIQAIARQPVLLDQEMAYDLAFVMHVSARGWILEKICRQIAEASGLTYTFVYSERNDGITATIPRSRAYFFAHYALYTMSLSKHPDLHRSSLFVWFTHPDFSKGINVDDLIFSLSCADLIFTANAQHGAALSVIGIPRKSIRTIYGGADPELFRPHSRGQGRVAFVGAFYERKQPDKMVEVIKSMPDVSFLLICPTAASVENKGLLWSNYRKYQEMKNLPNLEIVETVYESYPDYFRNVDVYVSLSMLEGGPIPLIEAMMANAVPVVTKTGFCEELVKHGENGFLMPIEAEVNEIVPIIRQALNFSGDVTKGTDNWSWLAFGKAISWEMCFPLKGNFDIQFGRNDKGARRYLREGWEMPETAGSWQFAPRAEIILPVQIGQRLSKIKASFRSGTVFGDVEKLEVRLRLNGQLLGASKVRQGRQCEFELDSLPADACKDVNNLVFEIVTKAIVKDDQVPRLIRLESLSGETCPISVPPTGSRELISSEEEYEEPDIKDFAFSNSNLGTDLPSVGWNDPEESGVWSKQVEATLILPMPKTLGKKIRIIVTGRIFEHIKTRNNRFAIGVSDGTNTSISEFSVIDGNLRDYELQYENVDDRNIMQITISLNNIFSPVDIGTDAEDHRKLGFLISNISFQSC